TAMVVLPGYRVYVDGTLLLSSSSTSVQVTELLAGGTRSFTVAAFDAAGNVAAPSAPLSVTTPALTTTTPAPAPADSIAPATPSGLAASAVTSTSLTLSWRPATDNVGVTGSGAYCPGTLLFPSTSTSVDITDLLAGRTCACPVPA